MGIRVRVTRRARRSQVSSCDYDICKSKRAKYMNNRSVDFFNACQCLGGNVHILSLTETDAKVQSNISGEYSAFP
jgi:hypothetical protein